MQEVIIAITRILTLQEYRTLSRLPWGSRRNLLAATYQVNLSSPMLLFCNISMIGLHQTILLVIILAESASIKVEKLIVLPRFESYLNVMVSQSVLLVPTVVINLVLLNTSIAPLLTVSVLSLLSQYDTML